MCTVTFASCNSSRKVQCLKSFVLFSRSCALSVFSGQSRARAPIGSKIYPSTQRLNCQLDNDKESTDEVQNDSGRPCSDPAGHRFS